jgi:putative nucleotidyltransferase with HDIG domain
MIKIMESPRPEIGVALLKESGLLKWIAPELLEGLGVEQKGHHIYDVWTHNLRALSACKSKNPITRLAVLLHDIGKPRTLKVQKNGERTFYNHEVIGARMALEIAKRLRLPKVSQEQIFKLVRWHMFSADTVLTDSAVKRIIRNVGVEYLDELIALRQADRVGSGARETSWRWEALKKRFIEVQKQPFGVKDLKVNGKDIMEILRIKPGPRVGGILNELFSQVEADLNLNEREKLLDKIKEYVEK